MLNITICYRTLEINSPCLVLRIGADIVPGSSLPRPVADGFSYAKAPIR